MGLSERRAERQRRQLRWGGVLDRIILAREAQDRDWSGGGWRGSCSDLRRILKSDPDSVLEEHRRD
jgi:hypothetical protein